MGELFGPGGTKLLDSLALPEPYASRVASQRRLLLMLDNEIDLVAHAIHARLKDDSGYQALLKIKGIGPTFAAVFIAEIGDVTRFDSPKQLACWAGSARGCTPRTPRPGRATSPSRLRDLGGGHCSDGQARCLQTAPVG